MEQRTQKHNSVEEQMFPGWGGSDRLVSELRMHRSGGERSVQWREEQV
jgi:hypothetical protein